VADWTDIEPKDAVGIWLPWEDGPLNEAGYRCPWPWEPQQLVGAPLGQYHCGWCMGMQMAGMQHMDWSNEEDAAQSEGWAIATLLVGFMGHEWKSKMMVPVAGVSMPDGHFLDFGE
jgi:hypothetical protein